MASLSTLCEELPLDRGHTKMASHSNPKGPSLNVADSAFNFEIQYVLAFVFGVRSYLCGYWPYYSAGYP